MRELEESRRGREEAEEGERQARARERKLRGEVSRLEAQLGQVEEETGRVEIARRQLEGEIVRLQISVREKDKDMKVKFQLINEEVVCNSVYEALAKLGCHDLQRPAF